MKSLKSILALGLATAMTLSLAACGGTPADDGDNTDPQGGDDANEQTSEPADYSSITYTVGEVDESKETLVVGTSADYAPYEFIDLEGNIVGFDIGLAKVIAEELDMNLEIKNIPFGSLINELNLDKIDLIISGFSPDPTRQVLFSVPYYEATQACVVRTEDLETYTDAASLAGLAVAAQTGSIQEELVLSDFTESSLTSLTAIPDVVLNLKTGKVEAAVMEEPVAMGYIANNDDLAIAFAVPYDESGSVIAFKEGNVELADKVNPIIEKVKADGTMDNFVVLANGLVGIVEDAAADDAAEDGAEAE